MVAIKLIIVSAYVLLQGVQSFCILNLTNSTIHIRHFGENYYKNRRLFDKTLPWGSKECCHYTEKDCSPNRRNNDEITFLFTFVDPFPAVVARYTVDCTTGGGVTLYGSQEDHYYACKYAGGAVELRVPPKEILHQ